MSPVSSSGPRRWIAVMLLLAGTLGITGTALGGICPGTARPGLSSVVQPHGMATAADAELAAGRAHGASAGEVTPAPNDTGVIAVAGICGATALAQAPGAAPAAPQVHSTTEPKPDLDPVSGPDPTPHDRPPRQS